MPPPPMPASLDPTTVSSLARAHAAGSSSPRGSIQWDKNGVVATSTPTSATPGRSSKPLDQGSVNSVPPDSNTPCSPLPSQVNSPTLPSSTSFPLTMQAQLQSDLSAPTQPHSLPLTSSVSPSATFSKLSLHSPGVSCPSLFTASEFMSSSSASTSLHRISDLRAPSPPHYRPSKPLHVHPQNEPPSFSASLSAPVVTLGSPDGMRDTPAEAQYQQPYRSSPESRHEADFSLDMDKRHANGEAYGVRSASPEILIGFPRLRGKTIQNTSEPVGADDEVSADAQMSEPVNQKAVSLAHDAMDIDGDVAGDREREVDSAPPHAEVPRINHTANDECSSLQVTDSSSPSEHFPHSTPVATDGVEPENHLSPPTFLNGATSQVEQMSVDPDPAQPAREPSPPPPPKVKMSLKDFALRKKKKREEEMAAKALHSPTTPDKPGLPSSPDLDIPKDLAGDVDVGHAADPGSVVNGYVKTNDVTKENVPDSFANMHDIIHDSGRTEDKDTVEENTSSTMAQMSLTTTTTKSTEATQSPPRPPDLSTLPRVLDEGHDTDQTQNVDTKPPATLTAKMEVMDAILPTGPVGADDCTPDVVSFAPEPPPPPLTIKQTSETVMVDRAIPTISIPRSIVSSNPAPSSASVSMSTSSSTSAANSRSNSVSAPVSNFPTSSNIPPSRRPSHEDGEITSSTPPKTYLPRSHTPPTQPRSFHAAHPSSPNFGSTSSSTMPIPRRPVPPLSRSPLSNSTGSAPTSSRPLPSGPRALRGSMTQSTHAPPYSSTRPPYAGSQYIPRGPSADRDRIDWDRGDRQWATQARPRGRAGSNGWGR